MQEFTFRIIGSNVKDPQITHFNKTIIKNITITDNNGTVLQELNDLYTENPALEKDMFGLSFDDWNFDGYLDITLWRYRGGSMGKNPHYYWLWDNIIGKFVENTELEEISDYSSISINSYTKQLECYTHFAGNGGISHWYKYENGKFVLVHLIDVGQVPAPDGSGRYLFHTVIKDLINGEMVITEDYYEDINKD